MFPTTEAPPLPRPLPAFLGEPSPRREHTQLPQLLLLGVHLALSPLHVPLGWGPAVLDTTWGRGKELLQTESLSPPLPAISTAEPKAALQCPGAARLLRPEPGPGLQLLRLQESSALWKKESKCCFFGEGTGWRSASSPPPTQKEDADAHSPVLLTSPLLPPSSSLLPTSVFSFLRGLNQETQTLLISLQ